MEDNNKNGAASKMPKLESVPLSYELLRDVFPFHIVFEDSMVIRNVGIGLHTVMPHIVNYPIDEIFTLQRPMVEFTIENIKSFPNNAFDLLSAEPIARCMDTMGHTINQSEEEDADTAKAKGRRLRLKGQMQRVDSWDSYIFLATPIMENLDRMLQSGMYINDLSMHDSSRDLVLAGTQQQAEINMSLQQEKSKSAVLAESMRKVDNEMKRTDALLYQMIPKAIADRLRRGEPSSNTCQLFEETTILFTDIVGFTSICSQLTPIQVVNMLNGMFTRFDKLTQKHRVYKVETIGDAYMAVSGAPIPSKFHAVYVADMALEAIESMRTLENPVKGPGSFIAIRAGLHSGPVVGGVVGIKMPRFCLIGLNVTVAALMESSGEPMRLHISKTTRDLLKDYPYDIENAHTVEFKGQNLKTYWLNEKTGDTAVKGGVAGMEDDGENATQKNKKS